MVVQEEHLAQFVLHLAGTEFGARHWDRTVVAAAMQVLSDWRGGRSGAERSIKVNPSLLSSPSEFENGERVPNRRWKEQACIALAFMDVNI